MLRALAIALGKDFFGKILKISLPRAREEALGKGFLKKIKKLFSEGRPSANKFKKKPFLCRGWALGKETANGVGD